MIRALVVAGVPSGHDGLHRLIVAGRLRRLAAREAPAGLSVRHVGLTLRAHRGVELMRARGGAWGGMRPCGSDVEGEAGTEQRDRRPTRGFPHGDVSFRSVGAVRMALKLRWREYAGHLNRS